MSHWRPNSPCLYFIPDLNGSINLLEKVCNAVLPLRKSDGIVDRIVFGGDYIDRHVDSHLVVDYLIELHKKYKNQIVFLMGNHEAMLLSALNLLPGRDILFSTQNMWYRSWLGNGGNQTLEGYLQRIGNDTPALSFPKYRVADIIPKEHIEFLQTIPVNFYETDKFIFVHGGCNPFTPIGKQDPEVLWWDRSLYKFVNDCISSGQEEKLNWDKCYVTGHNASVKPTVHEKFMMFDISATRKELLLVEMNSLSAMVAHINKDRLVGYDLKETSPGKK